MPKKIVLISSGQPSLNPRLVKEADALIESGFDVTVIYQYWNDWGTELDKNLLKEKKWKAIRVAGDPESEKNTYLISRVIHKFAKTLVGKIGNNFFLPELAVSRTSWFLLNKAKQIKADLYIGHNLGALPAAVLAAKFNKVPCGFDAEDFHRYEMSNDDNDSDVRIKKYLEEKYYPQLSYLSAASPLIAQEYKKLFPNTKVVSILNVFPKNTKPLTINYTPSHKPFRLFWFSQTTGTGRGLEEIIEGIGLLPAKKDIELHLLGNCSEKNRSTFDSLIYKAGLSEKQIYYYPPIDADKIPQFASTFDIGLATETGIPFNRDICLTNKIFTYMQAGIAILASDTLGQKQLLDQYKDAGMIYRKNDARHISEQIGRFIENPDVLVAAKKQSLKYAEDNLNWETESKIFVATVESVLF